VDIDAVEDRHRELADGRREPRVLKGQRQVDLHVGVLGGGTHRSSVEHRSQPGRAVPTPPHQAVGRAADGAVLHPVLGEHLLDHRCQVAVVDHGSEVAHGAHRTREPDPVRPPHDVGRSECDRAVDDDPRQQRGPRGDDGQVQVVPGAAAQSPQTSSSRMRDRRTRCGEDRGETPRRRAAGRPVR
jgi:hypothetical protein